MVPPTVSRPITTIVSGVEMLTAGLVGSSAVMRATVHWVIVKDLFGMLTFSVVLPKTPMMWPELAVATACESVGLLGTPCGSVRPTVQVTSRNGSSGHGMPGPGIEADAIREDHVARQRRAGRAQVQLCDLDGTSPLKFVPARAGRMAVHAARLDGSGRIGPDVADAAEPGERAGKGARGDCATHPGGAPSLGLEMGGLLGTFWVNVTSIEASTVTLPPRSTLLRGPIGLQRLAVGGHRAQRRLDSDVATGLHGAPRPLACTENGGAASPSIRMSPRANRSIQLVPRLPPPPVSAFSSAVGLTVSVPPDQTSMHAVEFVGLSGRLDCPNWAEAMIRRGVGHGMAVGRGLHESIDHDLAPGLDVDEVRSGVAAPALDRPAHRGFAPRDDRDGAAAEELLRPGAGHGADRRDQARRRDIALRRDELDASAGAGCAVGGDHRASLGRDVEPRDQVDASRPGPWACRNPPSGSTKSAHHSVPSPCNSILPVALMLMVGADTGRSAGALDVASDLGPCLHDEVAGRRRTGGQTLIVQRVAASLRREP